jgi:DNA-binding response OmpR family regulator
MLPKKNGLDVCRELRQHQVQTPIIMLTAKGTIDDKIAGLDIGADDYMTKPFGIEELFARIRAVLKRRKTTESIVLKIADLVMDTKKHEVSRGGKLVSLTPKEYRILYTLLCQSGEAINRRQLIDVAWNPEFMETNNDLNVHMRYLRSKIDLDGMKPLIHTVRGVGYTLRE